MDELIKKESEIKEILNDGFNVCCPNCHSTEYDFYPTGLNPFNAKDPVNDIWYICKVCSTKWASGFLAKGQFLGE